MKLKILILLLITCIFIPSLISFFPTYFLKDINSIYSSVYPIKREQKTDYSSLNILIVANEYPGEFNPIYDLAKEFYNLGANVEFALRSLFGIGEMQKDKMKKLNSYFVDFQSEDLWTEEQELLNTYAIAEFYLFEQKLPYEKEHVKKFVKLKMKKKNDVIDYFRKIKNRNFFENLVQSRHN